MKKKQKLSNRKNMILIGVVIAGFLVYTGYKMIAVTPDVNVIRSGGNCYDSCNASSKQGGAFMAKVREVRCLKLSCRAVGGVAGKKR